MPGSARPWPSRWGRLAGLLALLALRMHSSAATFSFQHMCYSAFNIRHGAAHLLQMALDAEMLKKLDAVKMESMVRRRGWCIPVGSVRHAWHRRCRSHAAHALGAMLLVPEQQPPAVQLVCSRRQRCVWRLEKTTRTPMTGRRARRSPPPSQVGITLWSHVKFGGWCATYALPAYAVWNHKDTSCMPMLQARCGS